MIFSGLQGRVSSLEEASAGFHVHHLSPTLRALRAGEGGECGAPPPEGGIIMITTAHSGGIYKACLSLPSDLILSEKVKTKQKSWLAFFSVSVFKTPKTEAERGKLEPHLEQGDEKGKG